MEPPALALGLAPGLLVTALVAAEAPMPALVVGAPAGSPAVATPATASPVGIAGNAYESPSFGWRVTWNEDVWAVEEAWSRGRTDRLRLGTGRRHLLDLSGPRRRRGALHPAASRLPPNPPPPTPW